MATYLGGLMPGTTRAAGSALAGLGLRLNSDAALMSGSVRSITSQEADTRRAVQVAPIGRIMRQAMSIR